MKHFYDVTVRLAVVFAAGCSAIVADAAPATPTSLTTEVTGTRVELNWINGDGGTPLVECGFEEESFPPSGWSAKVTNDYKYLCSWFRFPGEDFIQTGNYEDYIHSGEASAMMYFDMYSMAGDHDAAQDEWLVTPSIDNAAYLELYYYMDPQILEYGLDDSFPDHYYIKVSTDNGESWSVLWDARYDAEPSLGWHNLVLALPQDGSVKIAFQGVSDTADMVHFLWALDDVRVLSSRKGTDIVDGYTVMLDGEIIAEHVKSLGYVDRSAKSPGTHRYEVYAESGDTLSSGISAEITIAEIDLLPPVNVAVNTSYDDNDESYLVSVSWDTPQGVIAPSSYNVYCDGFEVATMLEENSIDFYGYTKGVYDFQVTAVYQDPDGESDPVGSRVAIDTRYNARNLQTLSDNGNVILTWESPEDGDHSVTHYEVWRGDVNVDEEVKDLMISDVNVKPGKYRYYVTAVYEDGVKALPAYIDVDNGDAAPRQLPLSENFDVGYLPADWILENLWDNTPSNLLWQFGDPNGIGVTGEGFDKGFASIDCINSGFYSLDGTLVTPSISVKGCDLDNLAVTFAYDYASSGFDSEATLEIETDNNGFWTPVESLESYEPSGEKGVFSPKIVKYNIGDFILDASTVRLRWHYAGMFDYHLAIDNVRVADKESSVNVTECEMIKVMPTSEGLDIYTLEGICHAEVFSADGRLVATIGESGIGLTKIALDCTGVLIVNISATSGSRVVKVRR